MTHYEHDDKDSCDRHACFNLLHWKGRFIVVGLFLLRAAAIGGFGSLGSAWVSVNCDRPLLFWRSQ